MSQVCIIRLNLHSSAGWCYLEQSRDLPVLILGMYLQVGLLYDRITSMKVDDIRITPDGLVVLTLVTYEQANIDWMLEDGWELERVG